MKAIELKADIRTLGAAIAQITKLVADGFALRISIKQWTEKRSLSQNALQHVIYKDISVYLVDHGRDWSEEKVKKALKFKFLGEYVEEITDVVTGKVYKRKELRSTAKLDKGEAYHYTTQIIDWAESIGCQIKIPANCEYRDLMEEQNQ